MPRANNVEAAVAKAVDDERERISAILELPEYEGRALLANAFIAKGMSVADAQELLAVAPMAAPEAEVAPVAGNAQIAAMNNLLAAESPTVAPVVAEQSPQYSQGTAPGEQVSREVALAAARAAGGGRRNAEAR